MNKDVKKGVLYFFVLSMVFMGCGGDTCDTFTPYCDGNGFYSCKNGTVSFKECGDKQYCNFGTCQDHAIDIKKDAGPHKERIEWWYYTGYMHADSRRWGFELTLFQQDLDKLLQPDKPSDTWHPGYMCHVAVINLDPKPTAHFYTWSIGVDPAEWQSEPLDLEFDNCTVKLDKDGRHVIKGSIPKGQEKEGKPGEWTFSLVLVPETPMIQHGKDGLINMGVDEGSSYYYSYPQMTGQGKFNTPDGAFDVTADAWMDHQWGDFDNNAYKGWDWWSMRLSGGWEIMLFVFRDWDDNIIERVGTVVDPNNNRYYLDGLDAFDIHAQRQWESTHTDGIYPLDWRISIPSLDWKISVKSLMDDQEMPNPFQNYWEGAVNITADHEGEKLKGVGYVELTGYATDPTDPKPKKH